MKQNMKVKRFTSFQLWQYMENYMQNLIDKILNKPIGDMEGADLTIHCKINGKGDVLTVSYQHKGPNESRSFIFTDGYIENTEMKGIVGWLEALNKKI